jgi:hypothetical protein
MDVIYAQSPTIQALARDDFAFAWAQNLTGTFNAHAAYSLNSSGLVANVISRVSTGKYAVTFPNLANVYGGNVLVTAHGQGSERCDVEGPGTDSSGNRTVNIECYNASGALANTRFAVSYTRNGIVSGDGRGAYLWSRATGPTHSWNSSGGINQVQKTATGVYVVTFPGQAPAPRGGTVQATAFKSSGHCKVGSWAPSGSSVNAIVRCYAASGAPADSEFMVFYSPERTSGAPSGGHAWANNATASSYSPHDAYEYIEVAPNGPTATHVAATRSSVGVYALEYPGLAATGSNALITAYGSNANYCKVDTWNGTASQTTVNVRCFNPAGAAVDTQFVSNYATSQQ